MQLNTNRFLESCNKFTQQEIAKHLGTSQQNVGRILRAVDKIRLTVYLDICILLEEDPSVFLHDPSE